MASKPEVKQAFERTIAQLKTFSFLDKQKQAEQKGGSGKLYCGFPCVSTCCARLTRAPHAFDCGTTFVIEVPPEYNPYKSYVLRGYVSPMP